MRLQGSMLLLACCVLAGCSGNGYVTFRGVLLVPPPGETECRFSLPQFKGTPDEGDYTRKVQGHFQESFAIDGTVRDYEVVVACAGYVPMTKKVHLAEGEFAVDLGNLMLTKE